MGRPVRPEKGHPAGVGPQARPDGTADIEGLDILQALFHLCARNSMSNHGKRHSSRTRAATLGRAAATSGVSWSVISSGM